jgi:hypothetical protein
MERIDSIFIGLKKFEIFYNKELIKLDDYEELIQKSILNILTNENKRNLFIGIEEKLLLIITVVLTALRNYYEDMKDPDNNILDVIACGDRVCYKGKIYKYISTTIINKAEFIQLEESDLTAYVPIKDRHLLTLYNGQATRINKVKGRVQKENITKNFISEVMETEINQLNGVINSSSIFVVKGKDELVELINSILIKSGEQKYYLSELFPIAYYTSEYNFDFFKGNRIKEKPLIKFVSNASVAMDIIRNSDEVKDVIFLGERTYKDSIETELRSMTMIPRIKNILILDTWESNTDFTLLINEDLSYKVYALTKDVILDNLNFNNDELWKVESKLQFENYTMAYNMVYKEFSICSIQGADGLNKSINEVITNIQRLCEYSSNNSKILEYIKISYSLCNRLEQSILPLDKCEYNKCSILYKITNLNHIINMFNEDRVEYKIMKSILSGINKCIEEISNNNLKLKNISSYIYRHNKSVLVIKNKDEISHVDQYMKRYRGNKLKVQQSMKKVNDLNYGSIIITYNYINKDINVVNTNLARYIQYILYRREVCKINSLIKKNEDMLKVVYENNALKLDEAIEIYDNIPKSTIIVSNGNETLLNNEIKIKQVIDDNRLILLLSQSSGDNYRNSSNSKVKVKGIISFEDNNYAFVSENYIANVVDRKSNDIKYKKLKNIEVEDEIIFVRNRLTDKEDIIKVIIKELLKTKKFKEMYGDYFKLNLLWKDAMKKYMSNNNYKEREISKKVKIYGCDITSLAISNWLDGTTIGPQNPETLKVLATLINDKNIISNIDDIILACKAERKIQIKVRKAVARMVIDSVIKVEDKNDEIYRLVKNTVNDLNKYAYVGVVSDIRNIDEVIGTPYVNCIIESED